MAEEEFELGKVFRVAGIIGLVILVMGLLGVLTG